MRICAGYAPTGRQGRRGVRRKRERDHFIVRVRIFKRTEAEHRGRLPPSNIQNARVRIIAGAGGGGAANAGADAAVHTKAVCRRVCGVCAADCNVHDEAGCGRIRAQQHRNNPLPALGDFAHRSRRER